METKDTSAQSRRNGGGVTLEAATKNKKGCSELWAQPCQRPLSSSLQPRTHQLRLQLRPRVRGQAGEPKSPGGHPARSPRTDPHSAWRGGGPGGGISPRAPFGPPLPFGGRTVGERRPARWTPDPGAAAAASSFKLAVAFPAETRHPLPSPHLLGCLGARGWRGTRAREAQAGGGGASWRDPSGVQSPSANALGGSGGNGVTLHPGSGKGGARHVLRTDICHAPSSGRGRPSTWLRGLSAVGYADGPGSHVASCPAPEIPARVRLPPLGGLATCGLTLAPPCPSRSN